MEGIVVPKEAVGIRFEEKMSPPAIQFVDGAFFPFGGRHEIIEGVERAHEILSGILDTLVSKEGPSPTIRYPDGSRYFIIPLHRR